MNYPGNNEAKPTGSSGNQQKPVLDSTVHIEEPEDEPAPRVRGLIELFNQFLAARQRDRKRE